MFDQNSVLKIGEQDIVIWPLKPFPKDLSCYGCNNISDDSNPMFTLKIKFKTYASKIKYERISDSEKNENIYKFQK